MIKIVIFSLLFCSISSKHLLVETGDMQMYLWHWQVREWFSPDSMEVFFCYIFSIGSLLLGPGIGGHLLGLFNVNERYKWKVATNSFTGWRQEVRQTDWSEVGGLARRRLHRFVLVYVYDCWLLIGGPCISIDSCSQSKNISVSLFQKTLVYKQIMFGNDETFPK